MDHLADAPIANILILAGVIFLAVGLFGRIGGFIGSIFGNIEAGKNSRVLAGVLGGLLIVGGGWLHEDSHKSAASAPVAAITPAPNAPTASPARGTAPATTITPPTAAPAVMTTTPSTTPVGSRDPGRLRVAAPKTSTPAPAPAARSIPVAAADREIVSAPAPAPVFDDRLVGTWTNLTPRSDSIKRIEFARDGQMLNAHVWYSCPSGDCDVGKFPVTISGTAPVFEYNGNGRRRAGTLNLHTQNVLLLSMDISGPRSDDRTHRNWVMVKPTLSERIREALGRYASKPQHRAFALAPNGTWAYQFADASVDHAEEAALKVCGKQGAAGCRVILVDDDPKQ